MQLEQKIKDVMNKYKYITFSKEHEFTASFVLLIFICYLVGIEKIWKFIYLFYLITLGFTVSSLKPTMCGSFSQNTLCNNMAFAIGIFFATAFMFFLLWILVSSIKLVISKLLKLKKDRG